MSDEVEDDSEPQHLTLRMEIAGHTLEVTVRDDGEFWAEWEDTPYRSYSFSTLRRELTKVVRVDLKRCRVPMMLIGYRIEDPEPIVLIGLHAGNNNLLYEDGEGKVQQERSRARCIRMATPAELKELAKLKAFVKAAEDDVKAWIDARRVDPLREIYLALGLKPPKCDKGHNRHVPCHALKCYLRGDDDDD